MLARVYSKKKQRPLLLTAGPEAESLTGEYNSGGMPRPTAMEQQQQPQSGYGDAPRRTSSRVSRAVDGGKDVERKAARLVKRVFGKNARSHHEYEAVQLNGGGVLYNEEDECELVDDDEDEMEENEGDGPHMLRTRRRFMRSGLTTYEQWISKNATGRRFSRQSSATSTMADPATVARGASPVSHYGVSSMDRDSGEAGKPTSMSSLASALQEVIHSHPTALTSIVDPFAGPPRVHKSFVVEQNADGDYFVASRRVPDAALLPVRQTRDDSFLDTSASRSTEKAPLYRNKWGSMSALTSASSASCAGDGPSAAAALLSMSKAGIRRRPSGADRGMDTISDTPIATAGPPGRRSSNAGKARDSSRASHTAMMYMDHMRHRSASQASDAGMPSIIRGRIESTAMLQAASSFDDIDAVPLSMDDLIERKSEVDVGPMTMDEFFMDAVPPPPLPAARTNAGTQAAQHTVTVDVDDDDESMFTTSFRNLRDVDALQRSRSMEDDDKVTTTEETETEEENQDAAEERSTEDYGSSYGSSCEEESAVRTSNISEFLGGFKSRNSVNRNPLAGRNAVRKDDMVSRAARSLRNSRKVVRALETTKVSSELSRKLREARARVPMDLRGDPPTSQKKRGFLSRDTKRVRFDNNTYIREFEVVEPEPSDDDNDVQRWQRRDSEMDDDDDDDDDDEYDENSTDDDSGDFGVPIPGAVLKAAMHEAAAFYSNIPPVSNVAFGGGARTTDDDKRVSVVSRKSNGTGSQFEILL